MRLALPVLHGTGEIIPRLPNFLAGLGVATASTVICGAEVKAGSPGSLLRGYRLEPVDVMRFFRRPASIDKGPRAGLFSGSRTQIARTGL